MYPFIHMLAQEKEFELRRQIEQLHKYEEAGVEPASPSKHKNLIQSLWDWIRSGRQLVAGDSSE